MKKLMLKILAQLRGQKVKVGAGLKTRSIMSQKSGMQISFMLSVPTVFHLT